MPKMFNVRDESGGNLVSEDWLKKLNKELRDAGIEQRRRPWDAIRRYSQEFNISVDLSSGLAKQIFEWFEAHSKPGAHQVGSLYESIYFYDSQFWPVSIPIIYGSVQLNALDSLYQMPDPIKKELMSDKEQAWDYVVFWADCVDYGMGIDDLKKATSLDANGMQFLMSGDQELRASVSILSQLRPDSRAVLTCRMAVELFSKAYIALKQGLTERQAKSIGHDLNKCLDQFIKASGHSYFETIRAKLSVFPEIQDRYKEQDVTLDRLWNGFALAQSIGALTIREHTDRNTIEQVIPSKNANN